MTVAEVWVSMMTTASQFCGGDFASHDTLAFYLDNLGIPNSSLKEEQIATMKGAYSGLNIFVCTPCVYGKSLPCHLP